MKTLDWIKAAQQGDKEARDTIIQNNTGLVWSIARRFLNRGQELEDLFQIGCIGLIKAVDHFDTNYEVEFSTYAVPLITGEIKRFFRDNGMVKVSRSLKERGWKIRKAEEQLCVQLGRAPIIQEIEEVTGFTKEEIVLALEANAEVESIDKTIGMSEGKEMSLMEQVTGEIGQVGKIGVEGKEDLEKNKIIDRILVEQLLNNLNKREKKIINMRFFKEKTQSEVAKELRISQVQVSRLEKKILKQLRKEIKE